MSQQSKADRERPGAAATGPIYRGVRYSPAGRRTGGSALVVGESEDKIKETGGDSLEEEAVERKVVERKAVEEEAVM